MKISPQAPVGFKVYRAPSGRGYFPSVSAILRIREKPYFQRWRQRVGDREADRIVADAQLFGTRLHKTAEQVAWSRDAAVEPGMEPYGDAVRRFLNTHVAEVLGTEMELVSPSLGYGGTCDLYARMHDGLYCVVDFKSVGGSLTREHGLQAIAYAMLLREAGFRVNRRLVVKVKRDKPGEWYARSYADNRADWECFKALRTVWYWENARRLEKMGAA